VKYSISPTKVNKVMSFMSQTNAHYSLFFFIPAIAPQN